MAPRPPMRPNRPGPPPGFNSPYVRHNNWRHGHRIPMNDWRRGMIITDYGYYHLSPPPYGYQWRYVDGQFVLAAMATGLIASIILAATAQ
jgi:Ni/Co efflux regulator RcnB